MDFAEPAAGGPEQARPSPPRQPGGSQRAAAPAKRAEPAVQQNGAGTSKVFHLPIGCAALSCTHSCSHTIG